MKRIYFTVTNDLSYDQRMHRICDSLAGAGFDVWLVGRKMKDSPAIQKKAFHQKRLRCFFNRGFLFYAEYNMRLLFFLLLKKLDGICAIDLDTIIACYCLSKIKGVQRIYDAHEYFTELKEVRTRPFVKRFWRLVERFAVPKFELGYTVSEGIAALFHENYGRKYQVIRNLPVLRDLIDIPNKGKVLLYQGAVNEARGFEYLIPAMKFIPYPLVICGDGNFMDRLKELIEENDVKDKVELRGMLLPEKLLPIAREAGIGIGLAEKEGDNQFLALPNKFLDYMHAGLPQITMKYPEYEKINLEYRIAILLDDLSIELIARTINELMENDQQLKELEENCLKARKIYCWQNEEKLLVSFYKNIFPDD